MLWKFKFCFLELSEIIFTNIFDPRLVETAFAGPMDTEGQL